jgi:tetratricopeptide (TPR) repeat protein
MTTEARASDNNTKIQIRKLLVPIDGSGFSLNAARYATNIAKDENALVGLGKYNEAIPFLDKALAVNPNFVAALNNKGLALASLGRYNESIPFFDKALTKDPKNNAALNGKKLSLQGLNQSK